VQLEGRSAIVTGGAGGLGAATARRLHQHGVGDVNDDDAVGAAIAAAVSLGPLSVVANIAGGVAGSGRIVGSNGEPFRKSAFVDTMAMNAFGTFNVTRLAAAKMAENEPDEDGQRGVVVNTGSISGIEGRAGQIAFAAAKSAIIGMTLPMARDLAPLGIRVCAIAPGMMGTPLMNAAPPRVKDSLVANIVHPARTGHPDEFALLVESIVCNGYLNGENIRLDGALRFPRK
jgi:NAD(P)-dependent dehydrogenase (short-subunit alcohol dehydrogenase family)